MGFINPLQFIPLARTTDPATLAQQMVQQNFPHDPMMQNLLQMAQRGDNQGVQNFAQNFFSQRGKDFNAEMKNFMDILGVK